MAAYANPARGILDTYKYVHPIRGHPSDPAIARQKSMKLLTNLGSFCQTEPLLVL
jgi:hypothetical protein